MSNRPSRVEQAITEMVTRRKSAEQKRQLRNMDRSMKRITELLRSPSKRDDAKKSKVVSPKKYFNKSKKLVAKTTDTNLTQINRVTASPVKIKARKRLLSNKSCVNEDRLGANKTEYYPKKTKRNCDVKKVLLKPNNKLQLIGKTNKRKRSIPSKEYEIRELDTNRQDISDLSVVELIQCGYEMEDINDDDLMEILTCPSPVWWEEPSNEEYCEEAIGSRTPEPVFDLTSEIDSPKNLNISEIELSNRDDKFMKKRSKLEHLLGIMKGRRLDVINHRSDLVANKDDGFKHDEMSKKELGGECDVRQKVYENTTKVSAKTMRKDVVARNAEVIENTKEVTEDQNTKNHNVIQETNTIVRENMEKHTEVELTAKKETIPKNTNTESIKHDNKRRETFTKLAQAYKDLLNRKVKDDITPREQKTPENDLSGSLVPHEDTFINLTNMTIPSTSEYTVMENETKSVNTVNSKQSSNEITSNKIVTYYNKRKKNPKNCQPTPSTGNQDKTDIFTVLKDMKYSDDDISNEANTELVCELCPKRYKKVHLRDASTINYCMSCSSIFDTQDCSYCESVREKSDHDCNACGLCSSGHFESLRYCGSVEKRNNCNLLKVKDNVAVGPVTILSFPQYVKKI